MHTSRCGLASMAFVACWTTSPPPPAAPVTQAVELADRDISGPYWCSIESDGYEYPRYPCAIRKVGAELVLAKLGGSQRLRGRVRLDEQDGFSFVGELYCPWGDCQQALHGTFKPAARGGFKGTFREESLVLKMVPAKTGAFGGAEYGGEETFDLDVSIGGATYGGSRKYRIDIRGRRRP